MELIIQIDTAIFYFINTSLQNPVFDFIMPIISAKRSWFPLWFVAIVLLLWKGGRKGRLAVLLVIPLVLLTDQLSASVLKPLIARLRPSVTLPAVHLLGKKMSSYSFPSSHASNFFGLATYFGYLYSQYKWWFFSAAALVGFSRISVGAHYPLDVLGGAVLGILCALVIIRVHKLVEIWYSKHEN